MGFPARLFLRILMEDEARCANMNLIAGFEGSVVDPLTVDACPVGGVQVVERESAVRFQLDSGMAARYHPVRLQHEVVSGPRGTTDSKCSPVDRYLEVRFPWSVYLEPTVGHRRDGTEVGVARHFVYGRVLVRFGSQPYGQRGGFGYRNRRFRGNLRIVAAPNADLLAAGALFWLLDLLNGEVEPAPNVIMILLAVAPYGRLELFPIKERKEVLFLLLVINGYLQNVLIRHVDLVVEALLTVVLHCGKDAAQDVLRPNVPAAAKQPLIPGAEGAVYLLKKLHTLSRCTRRRASFCTGSAKSNQVIE